MANEPRIGPTESSRMVDAEQRLLASMRSNRQQRLKIGPDRRAVAEMFGQRRYRRCFEQAAARNLNTKARTQAADQSRHTQPMTTKGEEMRAEPTPLRPPDLGKQPTQQLLTRAARQTRYRSTKLRRRQRTAVQLPVRRQRKTIQNNDR